MCCRNASGCDIAKVTHRIDTCVLLTDHDMQPLHVMIYLQAGLLSPKQTEVHPQGCLPKVVGILSPVPSLPTVAGTMSRPHILQPPLAGVEGGVGVAAPEAGLALLRSTRWPVRGGGVSPVLVNQGRMAGVTPSVMTPKASCNWQWSNAV